jgi:tRNA dimethylallyltransferase
MDIGTAKIGKDEFRGVKHYMLDIIEPDREFSVAEYKEQAEEAIDEIIKSGKIPVITGGTGLYIDSLIYPFSYGGAEKNEELRAELNLELAEHGAEYIHNKLKEIDPETAGRLHPNNTRRVIRAIEIASSGITMSEKKDIRKPIRDYIMAGLNLERAELYERINQRVDKMFEKGLLDEVTRLKEKYSFDLQSMQAIGYKEFKPYFNSEIDLIEIKELIKKNTRNYAKRQLTWFKHYDNIKWFNPVTEYEKGIEYITGNL